MATHACYPNCQFLQAFKTHPLKAIRISIFEFAAYPTQVFFQFLVENQTAKAKVIEGI